MLVLDTDHISVLQHDDAAAGVALRKRLVASSEPVATTAITLEEQSRSWIAAINRTPDAERQVVYYYRLAAMFQFFAGWQVLPFDTAAAREYKRLRKVCRRVGTNDLKIAAIVIVTDSILLTANTQDFERILDLRLESWL
jgi:tRNA(fMet)-specific endonuclease VapC